MIDDRGWGLCALLISFVVICGFLFIGVTYVGDNYKIEVLTLGDEVRTTNYYTECFNESFKGRVIGSQTYRYTVRDTEGNERTFEKKWLIKIGDD